MSNLEKTVAENIDDAAASMAEARLKYELAKDSMISLENERNKLVGPSWDANRMMSVARKALPLITKFGTVAAGGGGIAALMADPGAFKSLLSGLSSTLGGG